MKRTVTWGLVLGVVALAGFIGVRIGHAQMPQPFSIPRVPGTYLVTFTVNGPDGKPTDAFGGGTLQELATFTNTGQLLTSDHVAFGLLLPAVQVTDVQLNEGCAFRGELRGGGQGSWQRSGLTVNFMILWTRFDGCGKPNGFMRSRGRARPDMNGGVSGMAMIDFFGPGEDPINGKPTSPQMFSLSFVGARVPAMPGMTLSDFEDER